MDNCNKTHAVAALSDLHTGLHKCTGLNSEHNVFCCEMRTSQSCALETLVNTCSSTGND